MAYTLYALACISMTKQVRLLSQFCAQLCSASNQRLLCPDSAASPRLSEGVALRTNAGILFGSIASQWENSVYNRHGLKTIDPAFWQLCFDWLGYRKAHESISDFKSCNDRCQLMDINRSKGENVQHNMQPSGFFVGKVKRLLIGNKSMLLVWERLWTWNVLFWRENQKKHKLHGQLGYLGLFLNNDDVSWSKYVKGGPASNKQASITEISAACMEDMEGRKSGHHSVQSNSILFI